MVVNVNGKINALKKVKADLDFFFAGFEPSKSQNECATTLTSHGDADDVDVDVDELRPLAIDDWPKVPVSEARPLS